MTLAAWWAAFLGTHFLLSHPPIREPLVTRLGREPFRAVYSVIALATFVPLTWTWWHNRHAGEALWSAHGPVVVHSVELLGLLGFALLTAGALRGSPSSMVGDYQPTDRYKVRGILHVTRHPVNMGFALWGLSHVIVNGWAGDVVFFGGFVVLGVLGAIHQDWRMGHASSAYAQMVTKTTLFPSPLGLRHLDAVSILGLIAGSAGAIVLRLLHDPWFR